MKNFYSKGHDTVRLCSEETRDSDGFVTVSIRISSTLRDIPDCVEHHVEETYGPDRKYKITSSRTEEEANHDWGYPVYTILIKLTFPYTYGSADENTVAESVSKILTDELGYRKCGFLTKFLISLSERS